MFEKYIRDQLFLTCILFHYAYLFNHEAFRHEHLPTKFVTYSI